MFLMCLCAEDSCPEGSIDLKCKERVTDSDDDEPDGGQVGAGVILNNIRLLSGLEMKIYTV